MNGVDRIPSGAARTDPDSTGAVWPRANDAVAERAPRVLVCVIDDLGTGGAQRIVALMARTMSARGIRVVVVSLGQRDDERDALEALGVDVHSLPGRRLGSPGRILKLIRLFRQMRPGVVHTHLLASHVLAGPCARLLGIPVVSTLHNVDPHPRFAGTWKRKAESLCLRLAANRVIAVGPVVAQTNAARLRGRHVDVLPNPLSLPQKGRAAPAGEAAPLAAASSTQAPSRSDARARVAEAVGATDSTVLFLTVGRLASEKGWPGFLDLFDKLRERYPDCKLVSVGDGPLEGLVREAIAARGLGGLVHLLGRRDDVQLFYAGCDVFVLNSDIEGLPMALLEAMASGLPVVSTRVGDIAHATGDDGALLIDPALPGTEREAAMVTALEKVIAHPLEARERALLGQTHVLRTFDVDVWSDRLADLYCRAAPDWDELLRVVEIIDGLSTGGAQSLLGLRVHHARRMGYRMEIISLHEQSAASTRLAGLVDGIHVAGSPHVFSFARLARLYGILRNARPDIVHTHLRTSNIVGALCARLRGVPVVTTLHNTFPELGLEHARRDWAESWAMRLGANRILAVGPIVAETHQPRLGSGEGRKIIEVLPNPVEAPTDERRPDVRKADAREALALNDGSAPGPLVLTVGRVTPAKGLDDAVEVISRLSETLPDVRLAVVGDGPYLDALRKLVEQRALQERVLLVGRSLQVRDYMAAADAYLSMSHAEGLPLVLLEAMSMQLPVVATRVGDVAWLLEEGACGRVVEKGDVDGAAAALGALLASPAEASEVGARAFARVSEHFSVDGWLDSIDTIYRHEAKRVTNAPARGADGAVAVDNPSRDEEGSRVSANRGH